MKAWIIVAALAAAVAGCSGGGSAKTSTTTTTASVSALVLTTDVQSLPNTGAQTATVTVTALDANRNALPNVPVQLVPDNNGIITLSASTTDATGVVKGTLSIGGDHSNRTIDLVATSGSQTANGAVAVTGATLNSNVSTATLSTGAAGTITYHLVDAANAAMANVAIAINGPSATNGTTDANGSFVFSYTAPSTPSTLTITATAAGASTTSTINVVSGVVPVNPNPVLSASLATSANSLPVNLGTSTANQITVRALFVGANNQPMQNIRVRFDLDGDLNNVGGTLTSGSGTGDPAYSDTNGVATTTYVSGSRSSPVNGLTIRACWSNNDFAPVASGAPCPNNQQITIPVTVTNSGVSVTIFTDGQIITTTRLTYQVNYAVQVVDSAGQPQTGVHVSGLVDLPKYAKGSWVIVGSSWSQSPTASCFNEDVNRNGISEVLNGVAEDANGNGVLDPHKADVEIFATTTGSDTTDQFGKAYFTIEYGQNVASWDTFTLTFSAIVSGTEGKQSYSSILPVPAAVAQNIQAVPPFATSPYGPGVGGPPSYITDPATGITTPLCTNPN